MHAVNVPGTFFLKSTFSLYLDLNLVIYFILVDLHVLKLVHVLQAKVPEGTSARLPAVL